MSRARLTGGNSIPGEFSLGAGYESGAEEDRATATPARLLAVIAVLGMVVGLAVLPALVGLGVAFRPGVQLAAGLGSLVAVVGGVKLAAVIWGLVARFATSQGPQVAAASID